MTKFELMRFAEYAYCEYREQEEFIDAVSAGRYDDMTDEEFEEVLRKRKESQEMWDEVLKPKKES